MAKPARRRITKGPAARSLTACGVAVVEYLEIMHPSVPDHRYLLKALDGSSRRVASAWGRTVRDGLKNLLDAVECRSNPLVYRYADSCPMKLRRSAEVF